MLKIIDLFAGCGGLSLGFQKAGFDVVLAAENWQKAITVYQNNFDHDVMNLDLNEYEKHLDLFKSYQPEMIIGGPPCQDFSHAGNRDENAGRGNLTVSFARIIQELKPKFFVMENVDRLVKTQKYEEAKEIFKESGYGLNIRLMDASFCGVPQKRKRYFIVGELGGEDGFLDKYLDAKLSNKPMTIREYFGNRLKTDYYYRHPRNYNRRAVYSIDEPSATIRGVNRPIPDGYPGHSNDATSDFSKVRCLTTQERAEIQTFPKGFQWIGSKTDLEQLIGNAVPVKLAEFVASALMQYILDKGYKPEIAHVSICRTPRQMKMFEKAVLA